MIGTLIEIVDAQIHAPSPGQPLETADIVALGVELAREAMDSVGVDAALAVAPRPFIAACHARYPGRFRGVVTVEPGEAAVAEIAVLASAPDAIAGRLLIADFKDASLKPAFREGAFAPLFAAAEEAGVPLFISTHGHAAALGSVAAQHRGLTLIVDHLGLAQHPVSPPQPDPWAGFEALLALAGYPNVHVKLCGLPLLSAEAYPYADVRPQLRRLIDAFGADRIMWASDYTRLRLAKPDRGGLPPRGVTYAETLDMIRYDETLSEDERRAILGGTVRRVLHWPA